VLEALRAAGLKDSAAYPSRERYGETNRPGGVRVTGNCENFDEAAAAENMGLPARMAVCILCPYEKGCKYLEELGVAREAAHVVMTAARAALTDLEGECGWRDAVFLVNGRALDVLSPVVDTTLDTERACGDLGAIADAAHECNIVYKNVTGVYDEPTFFRGLADTARDLARAAEGGTPDTVTTAASAEPPRRWAADIKRDLDRSAGADGCVSKGLMRLCVSAARGRLNGEPFVAPLGEGTWFFAALVPRRLGGPVLILDPTLGARDLERALGVDVRVVGSAAPPVTAVQVCDRVTGKTRPGVVAGIIRGYLAGYGGAVGVVLPDRLRRKVESMLSDEEMGRLVLLGWGDRADALGRCGLNVLLGGPPVPPRAVRQRLAATGRVREAARGGDWGPVPWVAVLPSGETTEVRSNGYRDPAWREAYRALRSGRLRQALAGCPGRVVVHSDEDLGLAVIQPSVRLDPRDVAILAVLNGCTLPTGHNSRSNPFGHNEFGAWPIFATKYREEIDLVAKMGHSSKVMSTRELCELTGAPRTTMKRRLVRLERAGLVTRQGVRGGWRLNVSA
jgi:hypothetical protein